ncbi:E3 ubiquitin-protein ligase NHLRC1-like [Orbicella faveolata]|uniref:E3 ubiquitin-protein ligase NHLRC1-like n=1 Tax=Orbicella faveolata TaxID=48498 RepID=UPI0009E19463|nr:E3 ubiquitin-protein ligase NHLRC1-like [Orbicella faveolata]
MASSTPATLSTKVTTNYARLCRLLVDVGTQALRDTFDAIHAPANLHAVLANKDTVLQSLRCRKIINATQWGKLFPFFPSKVSSRDFDITLLMVLLRNLGGLPSPINGWDTLPAETDMSREADIARVKYFRNTVYAHAEQASVDDTTFNAYWQDIRDTLVRLGGVRYRAAIDNLETECMDPEIEDHYKQLLSEWKKDENNIKDELKEIGTTMKDVMKKLDDLTAATVTANRKESSDEEQDLGTNTGDNESGKYSITIKAECDGRHDVVFEVSRQSLTSSPRSVHVKPHQYHAVRCFGSQGKTPGKFHLPRDIAINPKTGNIAVADAHNKRVQLFSSDGTYLKQYDRNGPTAKKLNNPISVAFNSAGGVTVLDSYREIYYFTENVESIIDISNEHLIKPGDMTIALDGRMLVCDLKDKKVTVLSADGADLLQFFSDPRCVVSPCVALCHQDKFFVSYNSASCVKVYNSKGEFLYDIGKEGPGRLCHPVGLAVDKFNHLIVCDKKGGNVNVFTLEGKFVNSIKGQSAQFQEPWAVAVSNTGQVFITDTEKHCVHVFE